jgi:amino acid transporter
MMEICILTAETNKTFMAKAKKFGTFGGVFTPSILTLLGVIMYMRLPWITGQMGLWGTLTIIFVAHIVSGCTGLSVASIATDKRVETGGTYYIISRSLGLPIGGTLGWALFAGLSLSVSLYLIGFAEVFLGLVGMEVTLDNIRIMGSIILFAVLVLTFISTSLTIKTQYIILTIMVLSILSIFLGRHNLHPAEPQVSAIPEALPWITLFAIFFPAVTGFEAGVAMSGDLKDARKSIPRGTILAILTALVVYVGLTFFFSYTVDASHLVNDTNILFNTSLVPQLVMAGVLGATLSSALGSILGAPRILQAVANDRIAPSFLGKGFGASNEPRNALIFTYMIAQAGILIGELNAIARVVTIFFIITYGFLNITYTVESWASSDFRPSFKIPRIVSIIGALACIILMIQLDIMALGIAAIILTALFLYLRRKELSLSTGDSRSSVWLSLVKSGLMRLAKSEDKSRNWRPNIIVFSGGVAKRPHLPLLAMDLVGKLGIFTNFELVTDHVKSEGEEGCRVINPLMDSTAETVFETLNENQGIITRKHKCKDVYEGIGLISSVYGFSGFEPNTILLGWPKQVTHNKAFESLMQSLVKQDYNIALLKQDKGNGFGEYKSIDVWWRGGSNTLPLAFHMVRFLTSTTHWRRAKVRVLTVCGNARLRERYSSVIESLLAEFRIDASIKIISDAGNKPEHEVIREESSGCDLSVADVSLKGSNLSEVLGKTDLLTSVPGSFLFIHADSSFEEIPGLLALTSHSVGNNGNEGFAGVSSFNDIELPHFEPLGSKSRLLVASMAGASEKLVNICLENIMGERELFLEKLKELVSQKSDANKLSSALISLADEYKASSINLQIRELQKGIRDYIKASENSVKLLPPTVSVAFDREDYKRLKTKGFLQKLNRRIKLIRLSALKKDVAVKVRVSPAAVYYILYKRVKGVLSFYEHFTEESKQHLSILAEPENILNNTASRESVIESIEGAIQANRDFFDRYKTWFVEGLKADIERFILEIHSPQANIVSRRYQSLLGKLPQMLSSAEDVPEEWARMMTNQFNRIRLDMGYINLREKLKVSLATLYNTLKGKTSQAIVKQLDELEEKVRAILANGEPDTIRVFAGTLVTEACFNALLSDIEKYTGMLEESVTIGDQNEEYTIPLRKTADYYISNEFTNVVGRESFSFTASLNELQSTLRNLVKLANFTIDNESERGEDDVQREARRKVLLENILDSIKSERERINRSLASVKKNLDEALRKAFEPLSSVSIIKSSTAIKKKVRESGHKGLLSVAREFVRGVSATIRNNIVDLLYHQSEGVLWAGRLSGKSEEVSKEYTVPDKGVLDLLPFYYLNLFTGRSGIGEDFWSEMEEETSRGRKAMERFMFGMRGMILVTGDRRSGKSSLSRHLANIHFSAKDIFFLRAPMESTCDVTLFEKSLYEAIRSQKGTKGYNIEYQGRESLEALLSNIGGKCVAVIQDLELWWERKEGGSAVVERLIDLIQTYGRDILFIVNVNGHSLKIINSLTSINSWAIDIIECRPFPAKQLREFIVARHKAGGLRFVLGNTLEENMTEWDYARLFNHLFNLSGGNPGYAINLWLGAIKNISGETIFIEKPRGADDGIIGSLPAEDAVLLLQFVLHRRFSAPHLASLLMSDTDYVSSRIRVLHQRGILTEKFPGIFSLNPMLVPHIVRRLKTMELL